MSSIKKIKTDLRTEIKESILISEEDKKFWLDHLEELPETMLELVHSAVKSKNDTVNEYIETAIAENPKEDYLGKLKKEVKDIKRQAFEIEEGEDQETDESELMKELKTLDL